MTLRNTLLGFLLITFGFGVFPRSAGAQQIKQEQLSKFQLAQSYLRSGQNKRAIALLEDLHAENPNQHVFYVKLRKAYESVKRYEDALALIQKRLDDQQTPTLVSEKARLLYLKGDQQAADDTWDAAIDLAPKKRSTYRVVYYGLKKNRLFGRAIDVLERGRKAMNSPKAFRQDLARLYELTGEYKKGITEYLALLQDKKGKLGFIKNRLGRNTDQKKALEQYLQAAEQAVREKPLYRPYRELLAWLHTEAKQYASALDDVRAIDRLEKAAGRPLYRFAQRMSRAEDYELAMKAYQEILNRHPDAALAPEAHFGLALMHEKWAEKRGEHRGDTPQYEKARDGYQSFLNEYPHHARYANALRRLGRLQQDVFHNLDAAESTLQKVVRRFPDSDASEQAQYDLGRLALQRGALEDARLDFSRLAERLHSGELAEKARYQLALIHLYQGEFETAKSMAKALDQNTAKDVANDAIRLKVLLAENKGPDSTNAPLRTYARARLLERQHRHDAVLQTLDSLISRHGRHPLVDEARFLRAQTLRAARRSEKALTAFQELPMMHPRSPLADRSMFQAAQIQEQALGKPKAAISTYTKLLEKYPGSLLAADARSRIRALRSQQEAL